MAFRTGFSKLGFGNFKIDIGSNSESDVTNFEFARVVMVAVMGQSSAHIPPLVLLDALLGTH